jgi:CheY-like chemotaxis protein
LVDDDEVTRYLLGGELAKLGYRVLEARGGREAIALIEREIPDAVVLDIVMPDMDGFEVLRQIRDSASFRLLPVIVHSSREFSNEERKLLSDSEAFLYPKRASRPEEASSGLLKVLHAAGIGA